MAKHTFKKGDRVLVRNSTLGGREFIEGKATVVRRLSLEEHYLVRFDSEPEKVYERFVDPKELAQ